MMEAPMRDGTPRARHVAIAAWALVLLYAGTGLAAMWLAPRVPYADAWRFLAHFLQAPFPQDILAPDNGHHEVLPNAVRVLELHLFSAQQWLQVLAGIMLVLATVGMLWRGIRAFAHTDARIAALLAAVLGLFWLGNIRALAHGNESVHAYCVTLFLMLGVHTLSRPPAAAGAIQNVVIAAACGLAAAFSFGSGIACFLAYAVVLAVQRGSWRQWNVLIGGLLLTLLLLRWDAGNSVGIRIAPLQQCELLLRWLAGPFVYASWPLLDPAAATQIPLAAVRTPMHALAQAYETLYGPVMLARWPHVVIGLAGLVWLGAAGWHAWRSRASAASPGIGMACFAVAVGAMIVLVRFDYFVAQPMQLLAPRYVVWSSLFWAGLALASIAQTRRPGRALVLTIVVAFALLPSQFWMAKLGNRMRTVAEQTALAAATGVVQPDLPLGETEPGELATALPIMHDARAGMFAWPQAKWLGRRPAQGQLVLLEARDVQVATVDNRLGAPGRRVGFTLAEAPPDQRVLLLDHDGVVRGMAMRDRDARWLGWMQGTAAAGETPQVAVAAHP
jgi:hypothetical protein